MLKPHLSLASRKRALANSVDPDETPHDAASHQGLRCLLKGISVRNILNIEINILERKHHIFLPIDIIIFY